MQHRKLDRRQFALGAAAFASLASVNPDAISVQLAPADGWPVMPADFIGLSYETGQLYNPAFFSAGNRPLVDTFRRLNPHGVLRLGGHLSNITPWQGVGLDDPKQIRGVRHGIEDYWEWPLVDPAVQRNKHGILTPATLRNMRSFLDAVDWRLIYGLNFACGSAGRAADEASAVASIIGPRLIAFVIGNEVDGFSEDTFFRPASYGLPQFLDEYHSWVQAIRKRVPHAQFAGPDTDGKVDTWVLEFARRTRGDAVLLTSHYYGMGPASNPAMTAERLLRKATSELDAQIAAVAAARHAAGGTPYRMDEGNSCFGGGRKDVSDAYASALWAADYALRAACAGFAGVNFHGGGIGVYTPIESSDHAAAAPRPVYYGLLFAQHFAGAAIAPCPLSTGANITAWQAVKAGKTMLAVINKEDQPQELALPASFLRTDPLRRWNLRGPSLSAKTGIEFAPAPVAPVSSTVEISAYSAAILEQT